MSVTTSEQQFTRQPGALWRDTGRHVLALPGGERAEVVVLAVDVDREPAAQHVEELVGAAGVRVAVVGVARGEAPAPQVGAPGVAGDGESEGSRTANLRSDEQKSYQAENRGKTATHV